MDARRLAAALFSALLLLQGAPRLFAYEFAFGADLSFLRKAEESGKVFKDGTHPLPGLQIFRNHGYNWIRLRLFVEPVGEGLPNDLSYTIAEAQEAKKLGYRFLLDLHYANSWADPGKQPTPASWMGLSHRGRVRKVYDYTRGTLIAFREAGVLPDMVQVGNEVTNGILWPDGRLPENWDNFADYIGAGVKAVRAVRGNGPIPRIMIHIDKGGSIERTKAFFDKLNTYRIRYDVIGFSFYPWWHGAIEDLRETLAFAANEYGKDVIVVETAYNWTPALESAGRVGPYPETPDGQRDFLDEVTRTVMAVPNGRGIGVFWWEPAVGALGNVGSRSFFDGEGNSLPVLGVFDKFTRPAPRNGAP
jgi:arabinogalactan endo-1,4-beta-galactosidase